MEQVDSTVLVIERKLGGLQEGRGREMERKKFVRSLKYLTGAVE